MQVRRGLSRRRLCTLLGMARFGAGLSFGGGGEGWPRHELGPLLSIVAADKLQVPRRRPRKCIASGRPRPQMPTGAGVVI